MEVPDAKPGWRDMFVPELKPRSKIPLGTNLIMAAAIFIILVQLGPNQDSIFANICGFPFANHYTWSFMGTLWWVTQTSRAWATVWGPVHPAIKIALVIAVVVDLVLLLRHRFSNALAVDDGCQLSRPSLILSSAILCAITLSWLGRRNKRITLNAASCGWWLLLGGSRGLRFLWRFFWRFFRPYARRGLRSLLLIPVWLATWLIPVFLSGLVMAVWFVGYCLLDGSIACFAQSSKDNDAVCHQEAPSTHPSNCDAGRDFMSWYNSWSYTADDFMEWYNSWRDEPIGAPSGILVHPGRRISRGSRVTFSPENDYRFF